MSQPTNSKPATPAGAAQAPEPVDGIRTLESHALLGKQGVVYICHQGETYRLQTTRFGKLILTK